VAGGNWSEGALIGAAAGAGLGFLIGFTAGLVKAGSGFSDEPAASPACPPALAETTVAAEDNTEGRVRNERWLGLPFFSAAFDLLSSACSRLGSLALLPALPLLNGTQCLEPLPHLPLGETQVVEALQVEPEFGARAKEMTQAQGGIAGDGALAIQDSGNAIGRYVQLPRELGGAHVVERRGRLETIELELRGPLNR